MRNRWRRCRRAAFVMVIVVGMLALPPAGALANHESTTIDVGIANDGSTGRNNYDDSDLTVMAGTEVTFFFDNGFHNVVWTTANPGGLSDSPGAPGGDTVGSSFSVTPNTAGTYIYFCSIHTDAATALAATDFGADRPSEMYGRITVLADTSPPAWDPGSATATGVSSSQIDLTWPTATDDSGSVFFDVYQAPGATDPGKGAASLVGDNVSGTAFSDTGLTAGETYWYWITPVDGTGNEGPDLTASATTSSVAASASAQTVLDFGIDATLAIAVTPSLAFGNLTPDIPSAPQTAIATVDSNASWSMSIRSQDPSFSNGSASIPLDRAQFSVDGGTPTALTAVDQQVLTGQGATIGGPAIVNVDWTITPTFSDPAGANFQTTVLYTVTQP